MVDVMVAYLQSALCTAMFTVVEGFKCYTIRFVGTLAGRLAVKAQCISPIDFSGLAIVLED
jgi:hypothetical protein